MEFLIHGNIIHTPTKDTFEVITNGYIYVKDGKCSHISTTLPEFITVTEHTSERMCVLHGKEQRTIPYYDYAHQLIIPSFIDLHVHAPQFIQMGIGMDLPLIDWLNKYTFRNEERFANRNFALKCYPEFVKDLYENGTLRSVIFGTIHMESNQILVQELHKKGLCALVGKVNMNRNAPVNLTEDTNRSVRETNEFVDFVENLQDPNIKMIVTPRFAPSCTAELLSQLGDLSHKRNLPVQSHLSENESEVAWVKNLFRAELSVGKDTYSDVYDLAGLFGQTPTVMAHGIYLEEREIEMAIRNNVFIAHCPTSNNNLSSGIMPLATYLDRGVPVGLGSDVGAGHTLAMNHVIVAAIAQAKFLKFYKGVRMISDSEAFYIATRGNGKFLESVFGEPKIGCFEEGAPFDALVVEDARTFMDFLTPQEQLQRFLHCGTTAFIKQRFLKGVRL